jgi:hypothetical protein
MSHPRLFTFACTVVVFLGFGALAQDAPVIRAHTFEVGLFTGASYGIDEARVMGGGNVSFGLTKQILPYVEYSYFPGIGRKEEGIFPGTGRPFTTSYSIPISDFHGGVHIRFIRAERRVVPYGVFGMGVLHSFARTVEATFSDASGPFNRVQLDVPSRNDFAVNFGGGMRFYVNQRFGFRVEAKAYKPSGPFSDIFGKAEGGIFFQLR